MRLFVQKIYVTEVINQCDVALSAVDPLNYAVERASPVLRRGSYNGLLLVVHPRPPVFSAPHKCGRDRTPR